MKRLILIVLTLSGFVFAQTNDSQVYYFNSTTTITRANNSNTIPAKNTPAKPSASAQQNTQNVKIDTTQPASVQQNTQNVKPTTATESSDGNDGKSLFKRKCTGCHGDEGDINAFGISRKLGQMSSAEITERLKAFTDKKIQTHGGVSAVMSKQAAMLSKSEYEAILKYLSTLSQK
jgi:cytochrome c553